MSFFSKSLAGSPRLQNSLIKYSFPLFAALHIYIYIYEFIYKIYNKTYKF